MRREGPLCLGSANPIDSCQRGYFCSQSNLCEFHWLGFYRDIFAIDQLFVSWVFSTHHCNPCAASEAAIRGSIVGLQDLMLFMNSLNIEPLFRAPLKMYGSLRAVVKSYTVLPFLWEEFINLKGWPALAISCFFKGGLRIAGFGKRICMTFVLSPGLGILPEV